MLLCGVNNFLETLQVCMDDGRTTTRQLHGMAIGNDVYHIRLAIEAALALPGMKRVFYERGTVFIGPRRGSWIEFCRIY